MEIRRLAEWIGDQPMELMEEMKRNFLKLLIFFAISPLFGCGTERGPFLLSTMNQNETLKSDKEPAEVVFVDGFAEGMQIAMERGRPVLVFFMLPQCVNAQRMMKTTFSDKEIRELSQRFICILVDSSKNATLCEERNVKGFPMILLLSPQGTEIHRMSGFQNADELSVQMQVALQSTTFPLSSAVRGAAPLSR